MTELPEPIGFIDTEGELRPNSNYGWFPISGDSMTDPENKYSIPTGSLCLGREIEIKSELSYPLHTPVLIMGRSRIERYSLCKTIDFIDTAFNNSIRCKSYNQAYKSFWIPIHTIDKIFIVEQIKRPDTDKVIIIKHNY